MSAAAAKSSKASGDQRQNLLFLSVGLALAVLLITAGALLAGRRDQQLVTAYGQRRGDAVTSVNGTSVLAELFKQAGHRVTTRTRLSPSLENFDVVVWAPDDFEPPTKEQRDFLENWLSGGNDPRTLIYIGRDYDAGVAYWEHWNALAGEVPPAVADETRRRRAEARAAYENARSAMPEKQYARWFTASRDGKQRKAEQLAGPWAEGIDAKAADLRLEGRLLPPEMAHVDSSEGELPDAVEVLLKSGEDALATRLTNDIGEDEDGWGSGQIIVIANGSFILNYPLVNPEHRKLAARLVDECGSKRSVVFLESGAGGPKVLEKEPGGGTPTALDLLKVWPLNVILLHLTALGFVFCLSRSAIFGRPRELLSEAPTDFGKYVAALGQLLARSQDRNYAQARLAQYRQGAERKNGKNP